MIDYYVEYLKERRQDRLFANKVQNEKMQWKKEITYNQLKDKAQSQLGLWDNDRSFECFCNID